MKFLLLTALVLVWPAGHCQAANKPDLATEQGKIGYSIGYQVGGDLKRQTVELRPDMLVKGIQDAQAGGEPQLTPEQMRASLIELNKRSESVQKKQ